MPLLFVEFDLGCGNRFPCPLTFVIEKHLEKGKGIIGMRSPAGLLSSRHPSRSDQCNDRVVAGSRLLGDGNLVPDFADLIDPPGIQLLQLGIQRILAMILQDLSELLDFVLG